MVSRSFVTALFFKGIYFIGALAAGRRTWDAWRARRRNIRDVGAVPGETVLENR